MIQFDKEWLGNMDPKIYEEFVETTKNLDKKIEEGFKVRKELELKYTCIDALGKKEKQKFAVTFLNSWPHKL